MSLRRPTVPSHSSYAAVLAGQPRHSPLSSDSHLSGNGVDSRPSSSNYLAHSGGMGSSQHNAVRPATVPSYLAESAYAERLASTLPAAFNPPPTSALGLSSPGKKPQSHRGLSFEPVENSPPADEPPSFLPSRWNENDKSPSVELLGNGLEVRFVGPAKVSESDAAAVRADRPMPPQCGLFYYEATIVSGGKEGLIGIGFCTEKVSLSKLPGWEQESWGYHGDDGNIFCCQGTRKAYGPKFNTDDIIGCGVNFRNNTAFFTRNGHYLGVACRDINKGKLYPVVGMKKAGEHIRVNFGQQGFFFDIDDYMKKEKASTYEEINKHPISQLCPPYDETTLIQFLVSQYLAHDGYVDTAKAFAQDVQKEREALQSSPGPPGISCLDPKGDADAANRQKIRRAILQGDVDCALELTNEYYPNVLKDNELLYFRLRRRKLVEMIREVAETVHGDNNGYMKNSYNGTPHDDFDHDMDIDDPLNGGSEWDSMDVEDEEMSRSKKANHVKNALAAAVEYGQQLRVKFSSDTRPEIKTPLNEAVSLLAYPDPKNSVLAHLLDEGGRIADGEELNSAILVSLGKSSAAALERLVKQTTVLIQDISEDGGPGAFVNLRNDFLRDDDTTPYQV
ncbi:SPRY-domain-containing protein [Wilcoxina mikolae CBS 423.85]|nr:SPRY-domain-containing protein [Wilcoxina mikolae CBS 423.85]